MVFLNLICDALLVCFIVSTVRFLYRNKNVKYSPVVHDEKTGKEYQSDCLDLTIGRDPVNDIRLPEGSVSRKQAVVSFDGTKGFQIDDCGKTQGDTHFGEYAVAGHTYTFSVPRLENCMKSREWSLLWAVLYIVFRLFEDTLRWHSFFVAVPYLVLVAFLVLNYTLRADHTPILESIVGILLTFYIYAVMYPAAAAPNLFSVCSKDAVLGVVLYTGLILLVQLVAPIISRNRFLLPYLRIGSLFLLVFLAIVNIIFAPTINGARCWVSLGSFFFQPGELIKVLFLLVLLLPYETKFFDSKNLLLIVSSCVVALLYGVLIKDVGFLVEAGVAAVLLIFIQSSSFIVSSAIVAGSIFVSKLVLKVSATAAYRIGSWAGDSGRWLDSFTGVEVFNNLDYGYQARHALAAAFQNGGLFGNSNKIDVMSGVTAGNSDLVVSICGQAFGSISVLLLLCLLILMPLAVKNNIKQQSTVSSFLSISACCVIAIAFVLNIGGSLGLIPLTGVVAPGLSDGASSAVGYGLLFGFCSMSSLNRKTLHTMRNHSEGDFDDEENE